MKPSKTTDQGSHLVIFMPSGRRGRVKSGESLLDAARSLGVEIESICAGLLTCGKCKIQVEEGEFQKHGITSKAAHISTASPEEADFLKRLKSEDSRLSCVAHVQGDCLIFVPEESRAQKQIIRKSATERAIDIHPAVRQVYVKVERPELGEHRGDWGRLQAALRDHWQIEAQKIDLRALRGLQQALRKGKWEVTVTLWGDDEVIDVKPGYVEGIYGLAVDIGSTTVVGHLCDLRTGGILATESMMNPQVKYGEDLMSRISYSMTHGDGLDKLHQSIIQALNHLAAQAATQASLRARNIHEMVVVGNTTMLHLFLGIDPTEIGGAPFALANRDNMDFKARDLGLRLHHGANVHVLPSEAGHVGADNVGVLIAEEPYNADPISLVVDVGTNAEILLGNRERMFSASSPTGPAFEGAQVRHGMRAAPGAIERVRIDMQTREPRFKVIGEERWSDEWRLGEDEATELQPRHLAAGICGSGIIEVIAGLFLAGVIFPDGRFNPEKGGPRIQWEGPKGAYVLAKAEQTTTGQPILVTQDDVRSIQLAKAALYAGAKVLMLRSGIMEINRIVLAGAFGSYIDPKYAMILGLIPDCNLENVHAVGNAAGDGARIALLNTEKRAEAQNIAHWVRYIETAVDSDFQDEFVAAIHFPNKKDTFPHLEGLLPEIPPSAQTNPRRTRSRRSRRVR